MKQPINEIKRMQQLAGLITESQLNEKEDIVSFLNSHMDEIKSKLGSIPGGRFEDVPGETGLRATAGTDENNGIDMSFDEDHMYDLFPEEDEYNEVQSMNIDGKTIYYVDYRSDSDNEEDDYDGY